jgi:hypothetical protein
MILPHATRSVDGAQVANVDYLVIAIATMLFSAFEIWYCELPEVRMKLASRGAPRGAASRKTA